MNTAAVNLQVYVSFQIRVFSGYMLRRGLLLHMVTFSFFIYFFFFIFIFIFFFFFPNCGVGIETQCTGGTCGWKWEGEAGMNWGIRTDECA